MEIAQSINGLSWLIMIAVQFLIAYMALPLSGNHAGLCLIVPFYAFGYALLNRWFGLAAIWALAVVSIVVGITMRA
jgi:hypothetical protein